MTDASGGAPPPKKRSFFKRAAWQDATPKEGTDMFSHRDEFTNIVAEQQRCAEEQRKQAAAARRRKQEEQHEKKRQKTSNDLDRPAQTASGSGSSTRVSRAGSKARSKTPNSPAPSLPPPTSLAARYDTLTRSAGADDLSHKQPITIDLDDSDEDDAQGYSLRSVHPHPLFEHNPQGNDWKHDVSVRISKGVLMDDDDDPEEVLDPTLAALAARARESTAVSSARQQEKAPVAQLFISPQIPGAKPLMVKVRIDSTLEKTKAAWCERQGFDVVKQQSVFFTWRNTRVYDSTTIKRLGIKVDAHGLISIEGDSNIYDETTPPKVHVEAWTEELYLERKKEEAAEAAAKRKAAESPPVLEEREPTPELPQPVKKIRLILKAKGKEDFKLSVNADSTFGHIAAAYKQKRAIDESQPITLTFDGERLPPMDTIADTEVEDMDAIDVLFK